MKQPPDRIFLQWHDDGMDHISPFLVNEVMCNEERVFPSDVEYVREEYARESEGRYRAVRAQLDAIIRDAANDNATPSKNCNVCGRMVEKELWTYIVGERPLCPEHQGEG